jgi:histidinol-phosphate/aromatic aminotransferase/cobyric acid decarboxylase-like protein
MYVFHNTCVFSLREEQEKLNVWVALLNLENLYGTEESLQKVFERAVQYCEPMPVYQQLADIYAKCQKTKVTYCQGSQTFITTANIPQWGKKSYTTRVNYVKHIRAR